MRSVRHALLVRHLRNITTPGGSAIRLRGVRIPLPNCPSRDAVKTAGDKEHCLRCSQSLSPTVVVVPSSFKPAPDLRSDQVWSCRQECGSALLGNSLSEYRGRVMSLRSLAIYAFALGSMSSGAMADFWSPPRAAAVVGTMGIVLALLLAVLAPKLRRLQAS